MQKFKFKVIAFLFLISPFPAWAQTSRLPTYKITNDRIVSISNLASCYPNGGFVPFKGRIVAVERDRVQIQIIGFTLLTTDNDRFFISVDFDPNERQRSMAMVDLNWIQSGLSKLIREGNTVQGNILLCGAAGRIGLLNAIAAN